MTSHSFQRIQTNWLKSGFIKAIERAFPRGANNQSGSDWKQHNQSVIWQKYWQYFSSITQNCWAVTSTHLSVHLFFLLENGSGNVIKHQFISMRYRHIFMLNETTMFQGAMVHGRSTSYHVYTSQQTLHPVDVKPDDFGIIGSIPHMLIPMLLASPVHQETYYRVC